MFYECWILNLQMNKDFELEKLKIELRHIKGMYAVAQSEVIDASKKVHICYNIWAFLISYFFRY